MRNFVQAGSAITVPSPDTVASGAGVLVGSLFGIAAGSATAGQDLVLNTTGVWELPKSLTDAFTIGAPVYWDDTELVVTVTATDNTRIGVAVSAAGNPSSTVRVRLNGSF